jgi:acyl carrier protein
MSANTSANEERIRAIIVETLPPGANANSTIFGSGGILDSLGLVNFLADLEYRLSEEFDRPVAMASDQAMSRSRSPYRDVSALAAHVTEQLDK